MAVNLNTWGADLTTHVYDLNLTQAQIDHIKDWAKVMMKQVRDEVWTLNESSNQLKKIDKQDLLNIDTRIDDGY